MKVSVLILSVLGYTLAVPNGYYHQEYNYKQSSSSYKNNELQHQTDDQGYYRKDGDLAGKLKPRVDANSEHSEYVNPNLNTDQYHTGYAGGSSGDLSSYGNIRANNNFGTSGYGSHGLASEGLAQTDHIAGNRAYSAGAYGGYGSSSHSYGTSSNLRSITDHLQEDLQRNLQDAVQENRAYSQSNRVGISELERELRQNLTDKLNAELLSRYGQQSVRGGLSYSIIGGGRLQSTANYDNQELADLRSQLENSLLNQLKTQYQRYDTSGVSRYETHNSQNRYGYTTTTARPYYNYPIETVRPYTTRPLYPVLDQNLERIQYTPIPKHESISTIATKIQNQLDSGLNDILEDTQRKYFSSSSAYSLTNTDVVLERLKNELKNNLTYLLDEDIRNNYGSQIERDGYMYTRQTNGETSNQYNYATQDLDNLRAQVERNLIDKLNRDFETYRTRWSQQSQQTYGHSQYGGSNVNYGYTTPRYEVFNTPHYNLYNPNEDNPSSRPISSHITSGGSNSNQYKYIAGTKNAGYAVSGSGGSVSNLQRQLQQDLSRQLQAAINRGQYSSHSVSGSHNPSSYQVSLQQLSDELNRNLTRQLQEYSAGGYYSTYGNVNQEQMANLRNQLQSDLMKQLQQGLQQQYYSTSSSYSASSSSSSSDNANYRPVRGFQNYQSGQYRTGGDVAHIAGEDCVGDDPNSYISHRTKRSMYQPYRSQPLGISNTGHYRDYDSPYHSHYNHNSHMPHPPQHYQHPNDDVEITQQVTDPDLTQQVEDQDFQKIELGQETDDSDLTQQIQTSPFGKLETGLHGHQHIELGQETDDSDLTQQVQNPQLQISSDYNQEQQLHLSDHTRYNQQKPHQMRHSNQEPDNSYSTQQNEDSSFGRLHLSSHHQQIELGQEADDSDLTQQVEDSHIGKLHLGSQNQQQIELGQETDDSDLTQQVEDNHFGSQSHGNIATGQESTYHVPLHVNTLDPQRGQSDSQHFSSSYRNFHSSSHHTVSDYGREQVDNTDLTQQVEDNVPGKLQYGSQHPQTFVNQEDAFMRKPEKTQLIEELRDNLLNQIKSAIKTQYSTESDTSVPQSKVIYEKLNGELRANITRLLYQDRPNGHSYSSYFTRQALRDIREQLENELKLSIQQEITRSISYRPDNNFVSQQTGQLVDVIDDDLTQQVGADSNLEQQVQNLDLNQQVQENSFHQNANINSQSQLQFGSQHTEQSHDLTQQVEDDDFGKYQFGQQETDQQLTQQEFQQHNGDHFDSNAEKINHNQQTDNNDFDQSQIPAANLQLGNRPIAQKPIGNNFLQAEINQQEQDILDSQQYRHYYHRNNVNKPSSNLPTLNQVIQQQQLENIDTEAVLNAQKPSRVSNNDDINQHIDVQQELTNENPITIPQQNSDIESIQTNSGQSVVVTSQGQFISHPQTRTDAENQADLLIQKLRSLQNNPTHSQNHDDSSQTINQVNTEQHTSQSGFYDQTNRDNQEETSLVHLNEFHFNQKQQQLAKEIEDDLSKQLQDCVSNNYNGRVSTSQPYRITFEQLSRELERNITKKLEENNRQYDTSYSTYGNLNTEQREKLLNQLQEDLLKQLQQNLRTTYGFQQTHIEQNSHGYGNGYTSVSHNYDHSYVTKPKIHYGQQNELVEDTEDISDIHQVQPQQAHAIQNVESTTHYNIGVKGQNRYRTTEPPSLPNAIISESVHTSNIESELSQSPDIKHEDLTTEVPTENLPWWKRVGNKIKYGASNLKDKIIG